MTRKEFLEQFSVVWQMRHDLADGMEEELKEIINEAKELPKDADFEELAEWTDSILNDWGYPTVFGE